MPVDPEKPTLSYEVTRRKFIAVAAGTAGAMLINPSLVHGTAANSAVRVGLLHGVPVTTVWTLNLEAEV